MRFHLGLHRGDARGRRKLATLLGLCLVLGGMFTLVSYSVTLYRLFCQVTGAGGYTARAQSDTGTQLARVVTVGFDTNVAPGMPWRFEPVQRQVTVHLGQDTLVFFRAENLSDHDIVGHATFNVTPDRTGPYFKKIQCFCFTEERLGAHQSVEMPVDFFVDPRMAQDPAMEDVDHIELSYTFFPVAPAERSRGSGAVRRREAQCGSRARAVRHGVQRVPCARSQQGGTGAGRGGWTRGRQRAGLSLLSRAGARACRVERSDAGRVADQPGQVHPRRDHADGGA